MCYKHGTISLLRFQMDFEYNSYRLYQDRRELTIEVKGSEANNCMVKHEYILTNKSYG